MIITTHELESSYSPISMFRDRRGFQSLLDWTFLWWAYLWFDCLMASLASKNCYSIGNWTNDNTGYNPKMIWLSGFICLGDLTVGLMGLITTSSIVGWSDKPARGTLKDGDVYGSTPVAFFYLEEDWDWRHPKVPMSLKRKNDWGVEPKSSAKSDVRVGQSYPAVASSANQELGCNAKFGNLSSLGSHDLVVKSGSITIPMWYL